MLTDISSCNLMRVSIKIEVVAFNINQTTEGMGKWNCKTLGHGKIELIDVYGRVSKLLHRDMLTDNLYLHKC